MEMQEPADKAAEAGEFRFSPGEEVLAHLSGAMISNVDSSPRETVPVMPPWTIGSIVARRAREQPLYLLSFRHEGAAYVCWIEESAIEGTV